MSFNPIQSAIAGPAPNSTYILQFPSNITAGDLLIVKVWGGSGFSGMTASVTDDQGNAYTSDVTAVSLRSGFAAVSAWIFSAVATTGGVRPTVNVVLGIGFSGLFLSGVSIAEYPKPDSTRLDTTASGADNGSAGFSTASLTTGHNSEVVIALGASDAGSIGGSGWTSRDVWSSGSFGADSEDQTVASSGTSCTETESTSTGSDVSVILLAAYRISVAVVYNESLSLGVSAGTSDLAIVLFAGLLNLGVAGGTADSGVAAIRDAATLGASLGTLTSVSNLIRQSFTFGVLAGTSDSIVAAIVASISLGALAAAFGNAQATLQDAIALGTLDGTAASPQLVIQAAESLGLAAGTSASVQAIIAGAIAAGIVQGIVANSGGATIYNDSIGLGVGAATQAGAAVGGSLAVSLGISGGMGADVRLDVNDTALLAALFSVQPAAVLRAATQVGIGVGARIASSAATTFRDHIALAAFAATLARYITPATIRLLIVPALQRSFVACENATLLHVPYLQRSFVGHEDVMLYAFKHPASTEDFTFDLSALGMGTTIDSITVPAVSGLTFEDRGAGLPTAAIRIGGGVDGHSYLVTILANLDSGEVKTANLTLIVQYTQIPVQKDPNANENFQIDWIPELDGDSVASGAWPATPPAGIIISNKTNDGNSASAWIGGGAVGKYSLTNQITTAGGQVKACDLVMMITAQ